MGVKLTTKRIISSTKQPAYGDHQRIDTTIFENNCTPEEATRVYQYLQAHKDELDEWLPDQEWEAFEATTPSAYRSKQPMVRAN